MINDAILSIERLLWYRRRIFLHLHRDILDMMKIVVNSFVYLTGKWGYTDINLIGKWR